jgi:hypothetical protein
LYCDNHYYLDFHQSWMKKNTPDKRWCGIVRQFSRRERLGNSRHMCCCAWVACVRHLFCAYPSGYQLQEHYAFRRRLCSNPSQLSCLCPILPVKFYFACIFANMSVTWWVLTPPWFGNQRITEHVP